MSYDINSAYPAAISVTDANGVLTTPTTITLTATSPDQIVTHPVPDNPSTGKYSKNVLLDKEGLWKFEWLTTGPNTSKIDYESAVVFRSIVSLDEMRQYLHLVSTVNDELIRGLMHDTTELIEKFVGTCVIRTFTDDFIQGSQKVALKLPHGPCPTVNSVTSISSVWPGGPFWGPADLIVNPQYGICDAVNFLGFWYGPWKATYTAGRAAIPQSIILACKIIVDDLFAQHRQTTNDPLSPSYSDETDIMDRMPSDYEMPPRAMSLINRFKKPGFA